MRTEPLWEDRLPELEGQRVPVNCLMWRPNGTQLLVGVGTRVMIYDAETGSAVGQPMKAHKDTVFCMCFDPNNKRYATGSADKTVIIWTPNNEGKLKYQHSDAILCLAHNPVSPQLASCTSTDFGLWSLDARQVTKIRLPSRALCCAWTNDGQHLAIGLFSGVISLRVRTGEEKLTIKRSAPVWSLAWNPSRDETADVLAVGAWDGTLSFHHLSGRPIGRDRALGYDPCVVSYFSNGEFLLVGGSDRRITLWTKGGVRLGQIAAFDDWVWAAAQRPKMNVVATGTNDGRVAVVALTFSTVHALHQDTYAYRDNMTDVVVEQLVAERRVRIRCNDYVRKIAVYRDRLAVLLPDRVVVHELYVEDGELRHRPRERIARAFDCNLLVVTMLNLVLCLERKLQLFSFSGVKVREWVLDSPIRYIKVVGGPPGREALLAGLKSGAVLKIFVDNPFPVPLVQLAAPVRCLDLSSSRTKLAVVDELQCMHVFDLRTAARDLIMQEQRVSSVAWNSEHEDMLCHGGDGMLSIRTAAFPPHVQRLVGFVVGFKGSKIFYLHSVKMHTVDVPHSHSLLRFLERRDFDAAYRIACLGVTDADWRLLGIQALAALKLGVARRAFIRLRDVRFLELLARIDVERRDPTAHDDVFVAEVYAYEGRFKDAARLFQKAGRVDKAIELFTDLKMWADAKALCPSDEKLKDLVRRQARWCEEAGEWSDAALMWIAAGEHQRAVVVMGERGWLDQLADVCRQLPKSETTCLQLAANYFRRHSAFEHARDALAKLGDAKQLVHLHVEFQKWQEAFVLVEGKPELVPDVYLPYAEWLALNDRFVEAQDAFRTAGRPHDVLRMLEQLALNGVAERRHADAASFFWRLAQEHLALVRAEEAEVAAHNAAVAAGTAAGPPRQLSDDALRRCATFQQLYERAELYFAYASIHRYNEIPFTAVDPGNLFHTARYLLMAIAARNGDVPAGISRLHVLLALTKLARQLETYKLARFAYEKLQSFVIRSPQLHELVDLSAVSIRAKPYTDKDDMQPICYRCSFTNPLLSSGGDNCANCMHPFVRSFHSFDHLPLVEFILAPSLSHEEAARILASGEMSVRGYRPKDADWREQHGDDGPQTLTIHTAEAQMASAQEAIDSELHTTDPFQRQIMALEFPDRAGPGDAKGYRPVECDAAMLRTLKRDEVFVVQWGTKAIPPRYFRNMIPDVLLHQCAECAHFFHDEDFEFEVLKKGGCPFCGAKSAP